MTDLEQILSACGPVGDPGEALVLADYLLEQSDLIGAAAALDRAYGLAPEDPQIFALRASTLQQLKITEGGLTFRYVPAGSFLMGSTTGDPDEQPVHPVKLEGFWMAEVPMTWAAYNRAMGWPLPPEFPEESALDQEQQFRLVVDSKIRVQYCETYTEEARDWHAHQPDDRMQALFGAPKRSKPDAAHTYDRKPLVAIDWHDATQLAEQMSSEKVQYTLPTEAQWEKAARAGLIGRRYGWGDAPPTSDRCDFGAFDKFRIQPPKNFAPNGYGLYGMCGGVWEWTQDRYDALAYQGDASEPEEGEASERVLRGGSWSDCADAVTVSFRMSRPTGQASATPNIGFRLVRSVGYPP